MSMRLTVTPRDPIIVRDGRPFGQGNRAKSLDWIYPSVFAGSLRTLLGKKDNRKFCSDDIASLKKVAILGPLPFYQDTLYFPKPLDCVVDEDKTNPKKGTVYAARPEMPSGDEGCDLPQGLLPVMLPSSVCEEFKPKKTAAFWSYEKMIEWLARPTVPGESYDENTILDAPEQEERVHVSIDPKQGSSRESMLFSTTGLDLTGPEKMEVIRLFAEVKKGGEFQETLKSLNDLHPLGGERRLVHWKSEIETTNPFNQISVELKKRVQDTTHVRMVLATPAIFKNGWLPGWIDQETLSGTVPGTQIKVKLHGAIVERWRPISGWCYETRKPKAVRRLVPAGSVYFFELTDGSWTELLDNVGIRNLCDKEEDNDDGFGLALWGIWDFNEKNQCLK